MRQLTSAVGIIAVCAGIRLDARQAAEPPLSHIALAKANYAARRLADAEKALTQGLSLMRQERADRASDAPAAVPDGAPYPVGGIVTEPFRRDDVAPWFSDDAVRAGAAGIVTLEFTVKPDGRVDDIRVLNSVPLLDDTAKAAAKRWRYDPPVVLGRPASVRSVAAVSFTWRTDPMPADYLDMARLYIEHRHYAHAELLLAKAQVAIRDEAKSFGTTPQAGPSRVNAPAGGRRGGGASSGAVIAEPRKVKNVNPVYPRHAQSVRIEGFVILDAIIGVDGKVRGVRVLKSVPALDQAAVDAVRRWEYSPAVLDGTPIEVIMSVTVIFSLR